MNSKDFIKSPHKSVTEGFRIGLESLVSLDGPDQGQKWGL